ncbi:MAG: phage major capsid protein [Terriglobia bacterium]|nr:phage major capsid protein [Terriglobia bacterium]
MTNGLELKKQQRYALQKAEAVMHTAEEAGRDMTASEQLEYETHMAAYEAITPKVKDWEAQNSIRKLMGPTGAILIDGGRRVEIPGQRVLSEGYKAAFFDYVSSNGQKLNAALYEGSGSAGGFIVPVTVEGQVVPLAPTDRGVREIATIIPTAMDMKLPRQITISTAAGKSEGDGTGANLFTESEPSLEQFELSAFMAGLQHVISWELAQDVPAFQQFAVGDMLLAQSIYEENLFVNGTGTGQAQGLLGNVGAGITGVAAGTDSYASELLDATFDVLGTLKTAYHPGASWLMSRATSVTLRKAQKQANLFEPVFVRSGGVDYLHGYPVTYSTAMPAVASGNTPALFGNFKQGYVIGDRGGSGINVKILDQPRATEGLIVLLAYRRTDGRVRRSEAIQGITLA